MDIREFALNLLDKNTNVQSNPMAKEMISAIRNNDATKGEQLANNILSSYGVSREDALAQAKKFFNL